MTPKVSVVIPNYNGKDYLEGCIKSLMGQDERNFEIIVVDDCSKDSAFEDIQKIYPENGAYPYIKYIKTGKNGGFCKSVNMGVRYARSPYVLLLNNDIEADESLVRNLYNAIRKNDNIFSVCARMISLHERDKLDDTGDLYCSLGWAFAPAKDKSTDRYKRSVKVFAGCGGATIYRKDVFKEIGGLDEAHFAYLEDIDIGYRAKLKGYVNAYEPSAVVWHAGSASSGSRHNDFKVYLSARNNLYLIYKNQPLWQMIVNGPMILAGIFVKGMFFATKGLLKSYIKGLRDGIKLCTSPENAGRRAHLKNVSLRQQLSIELELLFNTIRRFLG